MNAPATNTTAAGIEYLRTPNERFVGLPDWPYTPRYVEVDGLRMAYVDEGPLDGVTLLLLHGEPTWGYLYRRMIPGLVAAGYRVVAPDLIGFGQSDKPTDRAVYTYAQHVAWVSEFVRAVGLSDLTMFCQDWGGLTAAFCCNSRDWPANSPRPRWMRTAPRSPMSATWQALASSHCSCPRA